MPGLVWFRADLRISDNAALVDAARTHTDAVVALFIICADQWREHDWAPVRVSLLLRQLEVLSGELAELGIPLKILRCDRFDEVPNRLLGFARRNGCESLYFNVEHEWNERRRDISVRSCFEADGRKVSSYGDQLLLPPEAVTTRSGTPFKVFTPFARRFSEVMGETGVPRPKPAPSVRFRMKLDPDPVPERIKGYSDGGRSQAWSVGPKSARRRLDKFLESRVVDYATDRDRPDTDGTSGLSPYLTLGILSPLQCLARAVKANQGVIRGGQEGLSVWINELIWREFYRHVLIAFPDVSRHRPLQAWTEGVLWREDPEGLQKWKDGKTGVPIVDAAMRQLSSTGWMHNRLRMISASFLCKHLLIDWRLGEAHFMRHLVDGDLASNNGGWQWSASTGTDASPYFRVFQPVSQSQRFDSSGDFIRSQMPELSNFDAKSIHLPHQYSSLEAQAAGYPLPMVDLKEGRRRAIEAFRIARER